MEVVNISSKRQILIPKALREKHGVKPGSKVQIIETQNGLFVKPAPKDPIEAACGFLKGDFSFTHDLIKEHRKELENE